MNVTMLTKVAQSGRAADVVFKYLAGRERSTWNLNLSRVFADLTADGTSINREAFNQVFMDLQKAGAGTIVHGRRGGANRFMWQYNFREAANQTLQTIEASRPKTVEAPKATVEVPKATAIEVQDTLKASAVIQINIPQKMAKQDLAALLDLINQKLA